MHGASALASSLRHLVPRPSSPTFEGVSVGPHCGILMAICQLKAATCGRVGIKDDHVGRQADTGGGRRTEDTDLKANPTRISYNSIHRTSAEVGESRVNCLFNVWNLHIFIKLVHKTANKQSSAQTAAWFWTWVKLDELIRII